MPEPTVELILGDCLEVMKGMPDKCVDAILTDLPYGITACSWDKIIPFEPMWEQVKRICKGVFVTTASQPFTSKLVMSNLEWFKYSWVWDKRMVTNIGSAKYQPLRCHEDIVVFYNKENIYNPQIRDNVLSPFGKLSGTKSETQGVFGDDYKVGVGYPKTIISFPRPNNLSGGGVHPTQKPVGLYRYLIRTYTNEGDTVYDLCFGSGTTAVACIKENRNFIGSEIDETYYEIAERRIKEAQMQPRLI